MLGHLIPIQAKRMKMQMVVEYFHYPQTPAEEMIYRHKNTIV
jgi:hypothetical protein